MGICDGQDDTGWWITCLTIHAAFLQTAPDVLHLIGYSLGVHIAGLVASYINKGKLDRITGEKVHRVYR
jgi:hypothetical protein